MKNIIKMVSKVKNNPYCTIAGIIIGAVGIGYMLCKLKKGTKVTSRCIEKYLKKAPENARHMVVVKCEQEQDLAIEYLDENYEFINKNGKPLIYIISSPIISKEIEKYFGDDDIISFRVCKKGF